MLLSRSFGPLSSSRAAVALLIAATCGLLAIAVHSSLAQSPVAAATALAVAAFPVLAVLAWRSPLIFPYGAYAVLVPFDLLLSVPALGTAARLCGAVSGAALLLWLVRSRTFVMPGMATAAWGAFVAWAGLSMLWTMNPQNAAHEFGTLAQIGLLYAIVALVPASLSNLRVVFAAVAAGGLVAAAFGIHELAHPSAAQQLMNQVSDRVPLLVGNHKLDINEFADSLLLPIAVLVVAGARAKEAVLKLGALLGVCVLLYAMSLAASREAFIAVALMLGYFAYVLRERWQILGTLGIFTVAVGVNANLVNRFLAASASGGSGRLSIWTAGLSAFREHWLFGAGAGGFASAYNERYLKVFQTYDMGWSRAAHNMLIQNGVEYGIVGVALLAGAFLLTFRSVPRVPQEHPSYGLRASLSGGLLALCVAGFFVDLTTSKMLWLALALFAQLRGQILCEEAANELHSKADKTL